VALRYTNDNIEVFEDSLERFIDRATVKELRAEVTTACQFIEKTSEAAAFGGPRPDMSHINNATSTICTVAARLVKLIGAEVKA
jgi:hypothetical protein